MFKKIINLWVSVRHNLVAIAVLLNGLLIFKTVYGMSGNVFELFHISNFSEANIASLTNAPWFMLGVFLVINSIGLVFRARIAWVMSLALLVTTLLFTWHFLPDQQHSINLCIASLLFLILLRKDFNRSSVTAGGIFSLITFVILVAYATYGSLYFGDGFKPKIDNIMTAFYFSMVTMTTVGYGDILPVSEAARIFTISVIIAGITVFATSVTTIFGPLIRGGLNKLVKGNKIPMKREDHFIVCGTSMMAMNTINQLHQRGLDVTIITNRPEDEFPLIEQSLDGKFDIISGDSSDSSVLKKAGIENCRAILALAENDADNAFILLSARDISADVKTVVIVNDSKNINKIKMVQPDIILSPQLFGSEVLARMLNGEEIDNKVLISMLLNSGHGIFDKKDSAEPSPH
ncbi:voltage-gated potassium channel protein [Shewanella sp. NIFS-20-20]|uniref:voltage-gated potassium channel protein n=1 Tax=Shewanella sp. NIFS-20-20 TaxID=2853806 RepID=UPI00210B2576|nr:voltage-gated potassium channel protein [Shewanella sp. NIFS-20-20]